VSSFQDLVRAMHHWPLLDLGLWGLVLFLAFRFAHLNVEAATRPARSFVSCYTAARLVHNGVAVSRFYDDGWFGDQVQTDTPGIRDVYYPNPPTTAVLLLPLASLDHRSVQLIWTFFNLVCLIGAGALLLRQTGIQGVWLPGCIAFALSYQPLSANLSQGRVYVFLFGLLVAAFYAYRHQRPVMLGAALGLMLSLKLAGVLLWLLLLVQRRWRAFGWSVGFALVFSLGALPWVGLEAWQTYLPRLPASSADPGLTVTAYQTQFGFFRHLFTFDPSWNPAPLLPWPGLGIWSPWLGFAAVCGANAYWASLSEGTDLPFASFVAAGVILNPWSLDYHYVLLLVPLTVLTAWVQRQTVLWPRIVLGVAAALIAADLPYRSPRLATSAWVLLAYPKLYGAWLLWGLALWACLQQEPGLQRSVWLRYAMAARKHV